LWGARAWDGGYNGGGEGIGGGGGLVMVLWILESGMDCEVGRLGCGGCGRGGVRGGEMMVDGDEGIGAETVRSATMFREGWGRCLERFGSKAQIRTRFRSLLKYEI